MKSIYKHEWKVWQAGIFGGVITDINEKTVIASCASEKIATYIVSTHNASKKGKKK